MPTAGSKQAMPTAGSKQAMPEIPELPAARCSWSAGREEQNPAVGPGRRELWVDRIPRLRNNRVHRQRYGR